MLHETKNKLNALIRYFKGDKKEQAKYEEMLVSLLSLESMYISIPPGLSKSLSEKEKQKICIDIDVIIDEVNSKCTKLFGDNDG